MKHIRNIVFLMIAVLLSCMASCTTRHFAGGTDTETGGTSVVAGIIVTSTGAPAVCAKVKFVPSAFNPVTAKIQPDSSTTDASGHFTFNVIPYGNYTLQANDATDSLGALRFEITVAHDSLTVAICTLSVAGAIKIATSDNMEATYGYIYIPGTTIFAFVNNSNAGVILNNVWTGTMPVIEYGILNSQVQKAIRFNVPVLSGDTAFVNNPSWKYAKKIVFNTTITGADVTDNVYGFPVLIRLTSANFNFSQVQATGTDIRFTKADNTFLPYEIERWDSAGSQAEIWVKVDTVFGNDSTQYFTMYWGNKQAADSSNGTHVFDTANGFIGVWHMNENASTGAACIKDRTFNANNATPFGSMASANSVNGVVGKGLRFNGTNDYLNAGNVSLHANYSVGLWVMLDTLGEYERLLYKNSSYTLWYDKDSASIRMEQMGTGTWWYGLLEDGGTRVPMTTETWYYVTATFDQTAIRLYVNGMEVSMSNAISIIPGTSSSPLFIGKSDGTSFVRGMMDEIRIERVARSADWIRLCYMNQRIDDKLIQLK